MKDVLLQAAMKLNKGRKQRQWRQRLVRVMAMVVVFCTTYALILPAITMEAEPACGMEAHVHQDDCYTLQMAYELHCSLEAEVAHTHADLCYNAQGELICPLPEIEGHAHESACYNAALVQICQETEESGHVHEDACYDIHTELICQLPETPIHVHSESCVVATQEISVLTCQLAEHIHTELCYPAEEEDQGSAGYLCGSGIHNHVESCYDAEGTLLCSIPVHNHDAACLVANLDLTADVESNVLWEKALRSVPKTGNWSADVLAIAESQLGYQESKTNVILEDDRLLGYTRYGAWYGIPYGDWCAMYASFCLYYAGVKDFPLECQVGRWIDDLTEQDLYRLSDTYTPKPGDLIFFDYEQRTAASEPVAISADHVGFVVEILPATDTDPVQVRTIEGNTLDQVNYCTYALHDPAIIGYGVLPENPLSQEEWAQANEVAALVTQLPDAEQTRQALEALNMQGDKPGFEALRQELISRIGPIVASYEAFNDLQKEFVGSMDNVYALQEICGGASWKTLPKLEDDSAVVAELTTGQAEVVAGPEHGSYSEVAANNRTRSIHDGDTLRYPFTVTMESYYKDIGFGEARIKVELILPLADDQAVLDAAAMTWLEDSVLTYEYKTINTEEVLCQVLTGYKRVTSDENAGKVVSGTFTEEIAVNILDMSHGEKVAVIISAAMEHGCWDGECDTHGVKEKLTVVTEAFLLYEPLSAEQQQEIYQSYLTQVEALVEPEGQSLMAELERQIHDSYCAGALSDDQYADLYQKLLQLAGMDLNSVAEPSKGDGWIWIDADNSGYVTGETLCSSAVMTKIPAKTAMPAATYASLGLDSNSQIPENGWGGENSDGDMIWVSKTIEGTEQENIFDITLQIITKEEVNEVYKEPDMAVVVVMDISNTMTSVFSGETTVTRYDAAMAAAEQFMKSFAEETDGISKLGYVAFNTHGHEVFPMQQCATTAQATSLANTMRTKTKKIMDDAAASAGGKYASSHDRFTNIEAGLKMAADMLEDVNNRHKYIIFLSDGFPTTYLTASTSDGYKGYDPYTSSGTNGNAGVFYDNVMGVHCDYGTSYSDTAAIKARQMAVSLKNEGINIFSIGVDVEGQTIWEYHYDSKTRLKTASTVERSKSTSYYNSTGYEIGTLHKEFADLTSLTAAQKKAMAQDFKDWLKGSKSKGIGSGYYYESTDQNGLEEAYSQIFQQILQINAESSHLDWVATDPMPGMGVHELETIEFIGFWDLWSDDPTLVDALSGKSQDSSLYYNTATFNTQTSTISWDLKNSGYQSVDLGNNKNFVCALKYRVRLMNEDTDFVERAIYDTNDVTSLTYRIIEVVDDVTQISDQKSINFPIPKVFGYLSELNFTKVDVFGKPLAGAKFALTHDTANCGTCRGDGKGHVTLPVYEAVSGADGVVSFTNIPSGHSYILTETEPPEGYSIVNDHSYYVTVSYDTLTVTVTDANGNPLEWTGSIENVIYYTLPNTGGTGTSFHIFGGLLILTAAGIYMTYLGRKRQKGGA